VQATQEVVSKLPLATDEEFQRSVQSAKNAFVKWRGEISFLTSMLLGL